jgi:hypothetical protein
MAGAANYMYEKASVKGVGYKNVEMIVSTQTGFNGQKLVEKESGSGNVITEKTELEAERQLNRDYSPIGSVLVPEDRGQNPKYELRASPPQISLHWVMVDPGRPEVAAHWDTRNCNWPTGTECPMDYINFTKEAEFEYMPVSYQTGVYDQKWIEKLCVQNYRTGAVLTEMYTHAEHLQKTTEVKTRGFGIDPAIVNTPLKLYGAGQVYYGPYPSNNFDPTNPDWKQVLGYNPEIAKADFFGCSEHYRPYTAGRKINILPPVYGSDEVIPVAGEVYRPGWTDPATDSLCSACCTGVLEANLNSNVIGVAHIGWISRDPLADNQLKGRHAEYGRSVEDLTGVFSIEKFIQLWGNSTCGAISVDWLPCV